MIFFLRHGVLGLGLLAIALSLAVLILWRNLFWQAWYLPLQPLLQSSDKQVEWHWPDRSSILLRQQILQQFTPKGSDIQLQTDGQSLRLSVLLAPAALSLLQDLPTWPGWYLESLTLLPRDSLWSLSIIWRQGTATYAAGDFSVVSNRINRQVWQLAVGQSNQRSAAVAIIEAPQVVKGLDWQLLGYWRQGNNQGVWLQDGQFGLRRVLVGQGWQGYTLQSVGVDGAYWRGHDDRSLLQRICPPVFNCEAWQ